MSDEYESVLFTISKRFAGSVVTKEEIPTKQRKEKTCPSSLTLSSCTARRSPQLETTSFALDSLSASRLKLGKKVFKAPIPSGRKSQRCHDRVQPCKKPGVIKHHLLLGPTLERQKRKRRSLIAKKRMAMARSSKVEKKKQRDDREEDPHRPVPSSLQTSKSSLKDPTTNHHAEIPAKANNQSEGTKQDISTSARNSIVSLKRSTSADDKTESPIATVRKIRVNSKKAPVTTTSSLSCKKHLIVSPKQSLVQKPEHPISKKQSRENGNTSRSAGTLILLDSQKESDMLFSSTCLQVQRPSTSMDDTAIDWTRSYQSAGDPAASLPRLPAAERLSTTDQRPSESTPVDAFLPGAVSLNLHEKRYGLPMQCSERAKLERHSSLHTAMGHQPLQPASSLIVYPLVVSEPICLAPAHSLMSAVTPVQTLSFPPLSNALRAPSSTIERFQELSLLIQERRNIMSELINFEKQHMVLCQKLRIAMAELMTATDLPALIASLQIVKILEQKIPLRSTEADYVHHAENKCRSLTEEMLLRHMMTPVDLGGFGYCTSQANYVLLQLTPLLRSNFNLDSLDIVHLLEWGISRSEALDLLPYLRAIESEILAKRYLLSRRLLDVSDEML